jgi:hypothetical protein
MALVAAPASATPAAPRGSEVLAAAGIDAAKLAPGWSVTGDEVVWDGGHTRLSLSSKGIGDCAANFVCIWEKDNFTGRRLQFDDIKLRNLTDWGFNDKMSSWYNRRGLDARWYYDINGGGASRCMGDGARAAKLGGDNDKASSLRIYGSSTAC